MIKLENVSVIDDNNLLLDSFSYEFGTGLYLIKAKNTEKIFNYLNKRNLLTGNIIFDEDIYLVDDKISISNEQCVLEYVNNKDLIKEFNFDNNKICDLDEHELKLLNLIKAINDNKRNILYDDCYKEDTYNILKKYSKDRTIIIASNLALSNKNLIYITKGKLDYTVNNVSFKQLFNNKLALILSIIMLLFMTISLPYANFNRVDSDYLNIKINNYKVVTPMYYHVNPYVGYVGKYTYRTTTYLSIAELNKYLPGVRYLYGEKVKTVDDLINAGFEMYPNYINNLDDGGIIISDSALIRHIKNENIDVPYADMENIVNYMIGKEYLHVNKIYGIYKANPVIDYGDPEFRYYDESNCVNIGERVDQDIIRTYGHANSKVEHYPIKISLTVNGKENDTSMIESIGNLFGIGSRSLFVNEDLFSNNNHTILKNNSIILSSSVFSKLFGIDLNLNENGQTISDLKDYFNANYVLTIDYALPTGNYQITYPCVLSGIVDGGIGIYASQPIIFIRDDLAKEVMSAVSPQPSFVAVDDISDLYGTINLLDQNNINLNYEGFEKVFVAQHDYFLYLISFGIFVGLVVLILLINFRKNIKVNLSKGEGRGVYLGRVVYRSLISGLVLMFILSVICIAFCIAVTYSYNAIVDINYVSTLNPNIYDPFICILPFSASNVVYLFIIGFLFIFLVNLCKKQRFLN